MRLAVVARVMGLLLIVFSGTMLPPAGLAWFESTVTLSAFLAAAGIALVAGMLLYFPFRGVQQELRLRDGFVIVTLFWALLALFGSLPLLLSGVTPSMADAYFEAMSGITTTGATVISGLDHLPGSVNLWRGIMHFLGGGGIIVLAVAVLPLLGVGGMQLIKAETPGPMKETKLTPRIRETAKGLWAIYLGLNVVCVTTLLLAGMAPLDAIIHSVSAVSTGGFSSHDASVAYFQSPAIEAILTVFMFLGGVNFALHFVAFRARNARAYLFDGEFRAYALVLLAATFFVAFYLFASRTYPDFAGALRFALFQVVSISTTTGFATTDFGMWPPVLGGLLMILGFFAGSAGSTAGGIKLMRIMLLFKQGACELRRLVHPNAIVTLKLGGKTVPERTISAVTTFFTAYLGIFALLGIVIAAMGVDLITAFTAVAACLNNVGPGLGAVGPASTFAGVPAGAKWVLSFAMLLGRLELFTLLVLFTRVFWRT